jgi:uncharacterized nucleotidyltransferase DUF6036
MDNATRILQTLDEHLDHPIRLIIYGRAALQLGFQNPPPEAGASKDVDGIVPLSDLEALNADDGFWDAQEATNRKLRADGLYITHLFRADQVFLRRDWEQRLVPIARPILRWLRLFRPSTLDLILTKMMRGEDPQDMSDIRFLLRHDAITPAEVEAALADVVLPDLPELRDAFAKAKPRVLDLARKPVP